MCSQPRCTASASGASSTLRGRPAQQVQHVLERQPPGGDDIVAAERGGGARAVEVGLRMFQFPASQYVLLGTGTDLAVRAGADAQVVAEAPVVQVVRTLPAGARIGADLVLAKAGLCQQGLAVFLHVPGVVLIGNALRRPCEEHRVRFQGQLVVRDVRRLQCEGAFKIGLGAGQGLFRQRVHQVDVEIVVARVLRHLHRALGLATVVDAAQALEHRVVETLDAEAEAVHAGRAVAVEAAVFGGARVGFQGDLGIGREAQARAGLLQEAVDRFRREQAGRAATEEHAVHHPSPDQRQVLVQVAQQRVDVGIERQLALGLVRVEVAVGAFAHAPRQVHVQRQRRRHQARRSVVVARAGFAGQVVAVVVGVRHGLHR
ncbi:hypothetical protein G6F57_015856 [Rhizopus arrhizus]|nr:hypothetical protein G6F57_015856 [Rhizopus arrhizus]